MYHKFGAIGGIEPIVIRTRFDMAPSTYPVFSNARSEFHHSGRPIIFTADYGRNQPDMLLYTTLQVFLRVKPMWMPSMCPYSNETSPLVMEDWIMGKERLWRVNTNVSANLSAVQVGKSPRLYCDCPGSFRNQSDDNPFETYCRPWASTTPIMRSTKTVYTCPKSSKAEISLQPHCKISVPAARDAAAREPLAGDELEDEDLLSMLR
jgi:hypothetical protein